MLSAKGILPVGDGFSVYGKIGPAIQDLSFSYGGSTHQDPESLVTLYLGLGAQYNINSNLYVGVLGSYFMKRKRDNDSSKNYTPQTLSVSANIGYMF